MLKIKPQPTPVSLIAVSPQIVFADQVMTGIFAAHDLDCEVTSGSEGRHGYGSLHFIGNGRDYSLAAANKIAAVTADNIVREAKAALGREFDVVNEGDHVHVEWQPKVGVNQR